MKKLGLFFVLAIASCSSGETYDSAYDRGFSDGYAVGYSTTCEIRATMISGDWDTEGYKAGYDAGYYSGADQCRIDEPEFR